MVEKGSVIEPIFWRVKLDFNPQRNYKKAKLVIISMKPQLLTDLG